MKRLVIMGLAVIFAFSAMITACTPNQEAPQPESTQPAPVSSPQTTAVPDITEQPELQATPVAPINLDEVEEKAEAMMPILDSIVRTMGIGGTVPYAPKDEEFFWSVLYLMGENWGETHPLVQRDGDTVVVPRQVMQEFASAAFLEYSDLLPVPESYAQTLAYDEGMDAYRLAPSDMGNTSTELEDIAMEGDGSMIVRVALYEEPDTLLGKLDFTLVDNPYVGGITQPSYYYTVSAASLVEE